MPHLMIWSWPTPARVFPPFVPQLRLMIGMYLENSQPPRWKYHTLKYTGYDTSTYAYIHYIHISHITKSQIIDYPPESTGKNKTLEISRCQSFLQRSSCQRHRWSVFWETFCGCSPDHIIQGQSQWFFPVEISKMTTMRSTLPSGNLT